MRILILAPFPFGESPSQRYRVEHYLKYLSEEKIKYKYASFLTMGGWKIIFLPKKYLAKIFYVCLGFARRWIQLFTIFKYDYVYVVREAAPIGPPVFEWLIVKVFRKKLIYDFDDAIWVPVTSEYNKIGRWLKRSSKVSYICKIAYKVSAGNKFLAEYAGRYNKNVHIIPTVVDTSELHNRLQDHNTSKIVIGWTGTFSTLKYLDIVVPSLQRLQGKHDFEFLVIANKDPRLPLKNSRYIQWTKSNEVEDLLNMHIGLMPLYDDEISKGKCGFKAIQYMSLGIPALVSPVGVNSEIVDDGVNGFICNNAGEWEEKMEQLISDKEMRARMGSKARQKIVEKYSVSSSWPLFKKLFE